MFWDDNTVDLFMRAFVQFMSEGEKTCETCGYCKRFEYGYYCNQTGTVLCANYKQLAELKIAFDCPFSKP